MDYKEFARRVKAKHPDYNDMPDDELARKLVARYPNEYSDVTFDSGSEQTKTNDAGSYWGDVGRNILPDIGNNVAGFAGAIKDSMYDKPIQAVQSGIQMATGTPYSETPIGQYNNQAIAAVPEMLKGMVKPYAQPIDSFRKEPVSTTMAWMPVVQGATKAYNAARPLLANAADRGAMALGRQAMGFTKPFLSTEGKEINANNAVRSAYENRVITPLADAHDMRTAAQNLRDASGSQVDDILQRANIEPERPVVPEVQNAQGQRLLPAPRTPVQAVGPENVSTEVGIPAYQGAKYEYKAAGEGPQYSATEGATARPVNGPERINKNLLKDARSGKLGSDYPEPERVSNALPKPPEDWLFDQRGAVNEINNLRPKGKNGNILRGGDYDAQHQIIDEAINTIKAHGDRPLTWDEANKLKGDLQGLVNWDATKSKTANNLKGQVASAFKNNLDSQLGSVLESSGKNPEFKGFKQAKETYGNSKNMLKGLQNKIASDSSKTGLSMLDYIIGTVGTAFGGPYGGVGSVLTKKALQRYGGNVAGTGLFKLSKAITALPEISSPVISFASKAGAAVTARQALITQFIDNRSKGSNQ